MVKFKPFFDIAFVDARYEQSNQPLYHGEMNILVKSIAFLSDISIKNILISSDMFSGLS